MAWRVREQLLLAQEREIDERGGGEPAQQRRPGLDGVHVLREEGRRLHHHSDPPSVAGEPRGRGEEGPVGASARAQGSLLTSPALGRAVGAADERPRRIAHDRVEGFRHQRGGQLIRDGVRLEQRGVDQAVELQVGDVRDWLVVQLQRSQVEAERGDPECGPVDVDAEELRVQDAPNELARRLRAAGRAPDESAERLHQERAGAAGRVDDARGRGQPFEDRVEREVHQLHRGVVQALGCGLLGRAGARELLIDRADQVDRDGVEPELEEPTLAPPLRHKASTPDELAHQRKVRLAQLLALGAGVVHREEVTVEGRAQPVEECERSVGRREHLPEVRRQRRRQEALRDAPIEQVPGEDAPADEPLSEVAGGPEPLRPRRRG